LYFIFLKQFNLYSFNKHLCRAHFNILMQNNRNAPIRRNKCSVYEP